MEAVDVVIDKIYDQLSMPYLVDSVIIEVTASIGAAVYFADGRNCGELIKHADMAMYRVKTPKSILSNH